MPFTKGQSGNPAGRPPKDRALADMLAAAGKRRVDGPDGVRVDRRKLAVENMWDLLAFGQTWFLGAPEPFRIAGREYVELAKFVFSHVDGPAVAKLEHSSDPDRPLTIRVEYDDLDSLPGIGPQITATTLSAITDSAGGETI